MWTRASAATSRAPRLLALVAALAAAACGGGEAGPRGTIVDYDYFGFRGMLLRSVEGGSPKLVRLRPEPWGSADFTRDGDRLVYAGERGLYVANGDGSGVRYVRGQPFNDFLNDDPAWSPDGRRIVFSNGETLYTIDADGGGLRRLGPGRTPDWSPRDDLIVFVRAGGDVSVGRSHGGGFRVLARGEWPAFSPDGERVAYSRDGTIFLVSVDGGDPRVVTRDGYEPIWSPDGRYLAFARVTECGHAVCSARIFVMPVGGGPARPIGPEVGDRSGPLDWIDD